jgi:hypothetical protein
MTASPFVLEYDTAAGALVSVRRFDDPDEAANAVLALERRHRDTPAIHVVMLTGESLDSLKATHGTYFRDAPDLPGSLVAAAAA